MTVASGILKSTSWKKQTAKGSASSGTGGKTARRVTSAFVSPRDTFESNEIVTHHQSTGVSYGMKNPTGTINAELSCGTFSDLMGSLLEKNFIAGVNSTALTLTYGGTSGAWTVARGAGSFMTDGFKIGDVVRASGGSVSANNTRNFLITNVVALTITFIALDGATVTSGSSTTTTITVQGQKTNAPTTGHTKDYYTFEDWYSDISKSELFTDFRVGSMELSMPASGNATANFSAVGLNRALAGSQVLTSPTTTTTAIMNSTNGKILIGGTLQTGVTALSISVQNAAANAGAVIGSNTGFDITTGRIRVSGSFMAQFDSSTIQALFESETPVSIVLVISESETATSNFLSFVIPVAKITDDAANDGETAIMRTYNFVAEYNGSGGSGVSSEQTILSIQDSSLS